MSKNKDKNEENKINQEVEATQDAVNETPETEAAPQDPIETLNAKVAELEAQVEKEKKEYMFLMAEFDNFRKRNIKEKAELIKNATEKAMRDLLPVVDDFERAIKAMADSDDAAAMREGSNLIYTKFVKYREQNNVKPIISADAPFDTELHEAITTFPVDDE